MRFKKIIFNFLCIISIFIQCKLVFANETLTICADKDKNWYWLHEGKEIVIGEWKYNLTVPGVYYSYFQLEEGLEKYNWLQTQCINEFGNEFSLPHPSNHFFSRWSPFSTQENLTLKGHITYFPENFQLRVYEKP